MRDTDLDIAFCERYNLISDEYEGVSVTTLPFSVRVINRFIGNGITTVAELLKTSPSALMKLKGFGKNCLVEVDAFCATLNNDDSIPIVQNKKASLCSSSLFIDHRNEIAVGNFSVFEDMDLSETEAEMLQRYSWKSRISRTRRVMLIQQSDNFQFATIFLKTQKHPAPCVL